MTDDLRPFLIRDGEDAALLGALVLLRERIMERADEGQMKEKQLHNVTSLTCRLYDMMIANGWWCGDK